MPHTLPHASIPYLGQPIRLSFQSEQWGHRYLGDYNQPQAGDHLQLYVPPHLCSKDRIQSQNQTLEEWLKGRALHIFTQRARQLSRDSGLHPAKIRLTTAARRWGSCSSNRTIRLHWRLIHLNTSLIDYVIAHEFAHLAQMNHSPAFWKVLEFLMPDYHQHHQALKGVSLDRLAKIQVNHNFFTSMGDDHAISAHHAARRQS